MSKRSAFLSTKQRLIILIAVCLLSTPIWVRVFYLDVFRIPSASMQPTVQIGDIILANKLEYGFRLPLADHYLSLWDKPKRNQVILFRYPPDPKIIYIKRVVGLPGDHIKMIAGQIVINDQMVESKISYAVGLNKDEIIPPDHYFVMGDNRGNSSDSRVWGTVPLQNIIAKAELVLVNIDLKSKSLTGSRLLVPIF